MSSEVQRPDDSPSTSGGSSDIEQRETAPPQQERDLVAPKKKETKISSKTAAKLSTSAKRIQKELAEITLDPPPNCRRASEKRAATCAVAGMSDWGSLGATEEKPHRNKAHNWN
ncbi:Ubiquitin-conjugating enzyme E2 E2 [Anabarilius grahami]|uniref:Ubiquitin-conjugating enzyme E2 E2 n=1 Tax=Anabarilius grahami TaxID=495550 RepID=A0A3N0YJL3_ANAGA|nr:Ubiquitin-conjugating enzyme E2 E2 [Anabarilius grahami]